MRNSIIDKADCKLFSEFFTDSYLAYRIFLGHCFYFWSNETVNSSENLRFLYLSVVCRVVMNCLDNRVFPLLLSAHKNKDPNLQNIDALMEDFYSKAAVFCLCLMRCYSDKMNDKWLFYIFQTYEKPRDYISENIDLNHLPYFSLGS